MNFGLTTEQQQLADLAREILKAEVPTPARSVDDATWSSLSATLAETGLAGILVPVELGGSGATLVEAAVLGEAFGYAGAPGALIASTLLSAAALDLVPDTDQKTVGETIVNGESCAVLVGNDLSWPPRAAGDVAWGWLDGAMVLVPDGDVLRPMNGDGFVAAPTADLSLMVGRRSLNPSGQAPAISSSSRGRRFHAAANVIMSSVLLGHMRAAFDAAVEYAKQRVQYGAHIGSFQAIKHLCADMLVDVDSSRSADVRRRVGSLVARRCRGLRALSGRRQGMV